jgi:tetratricopeptide (TPR) repeat protein
MMNIRRQNRRAAPLIALLVIFLGMGLVFFLLKFQIPIASVLPEESSPIPASPTPFDPNNEYNYHRGRGEYTVALYHIEAATTLNGWTGQDHIREGNLWRDMGDSSRALPYWEAAVALEPNPNLLRQIAEIYLQRGEWGLALERIQGLLLLAPNDIWALYYSGLLLAPSDPATAYPYLARIASSDSTNAPIASALSNLIGRDPNSPQIALSVGAILASAEEWSLAENAYQYAADWYYPFPEASAYVGLMRAQQGKSGDSWISEAISLAPDSAVVQSVAGVYWRTVGEYAQSEAALITSIILEPDNPSLYAELGLTYWGMGNRIDAEVWLQTAQLLAPDNPNILLVLDKFYDEDTLMVSSPLLAFSEATVGINDPAVISANAWALYVNGDSVAALAMVEQALTIDATNPRALFDKARILQETGRSDEAKPLLEQLAAGDSPFAPIATRLLEN